MTVNPNSRRKTAARRPGLLVPLACLALLVAQAASAQGLFSRQPQADAAPPPPEEALRLSAGQFEQGQPAAALTTLDRTLAENPDHLELLHAKGRILRATADHEGAVYVYDRILALTPDDPLALSVLPLLLREQAAARPEQAYVLLRRARKLAPDAATIVADFARAAAAAGQHAEAIDAFESLDAESRTPPALRRAAADSYLASGRFETAAALYETLLDAEPENTAIGAGLADALRPLDQAAVFTRLSAILERHPAVIPLWTLRADISTARGELWEGLHSMTRLLRLQPDNRRAAAQRVRLLSDLGCTSLADAALREYGSLLDSNLVERVRRQRDATLARWEAIDANAATAGELSGAVALAYYDVVTKDARGPHAILLSALVEQLDYLRGHGYTFIGTRDVAAAQRGATPLPDKAALLTFHHAYDSFRTLVLPLLEQYDCPAVVAVPTSWIDRPPAGLSGPLMSWETIAALNRHPLVSLASQTHALANYVPCNPQGRLGPAMTSREYTAATDTYETAEQYRQRLIADIQTSQQVLLEKTGQIVDIMVWPGGEFNLIALDEAEALDFILIFALHDRPEPPPTRRVIAERHVPRDTALPEFARALRLWGAAPIPPERASRGMPIRLDDLFAADAAVTRERIDAMLARVEAAEVDTVYLQGYSDRNGDGTVERVYFPNRILPVESDLLNHVASLLRYRGFKVIVSMPTLSIVPPGPGRDTRLYVMEFRVGGVRAVEGWYQRLSPFAPETRTLMTALYEDLAAHVDFDGVRFENDAFLTESEDFSPTASKTYRRELNIIERNPSRFTPQQVRDLTALKTRRLDEHVAALRQAVAVYRPGRTFTRTLHGPVPVDPASSRWFAQDFESALAANDFVELIVAPEAYGASDPGNWIESLAAAAAGYTEGLDRTVFNIQIRDPLGSDWLSRLVWGRRVKTLVQQGARHLTYAPDHGDFPPAQAIRGALRNVPHGATP